MTLKDELRALELKLLQPEARHNASLLRELLAEEFREIGSSGRIYDREHTIQTLALEVPAEITLEAFDVTPLGEDAALVTYRTRREGTASQRSAVWRKKAGRWQMIFHQGTKVLR